jgi:hypothetical protein
MARPVLSKTKKAMALLDKVHPKYPDRRYTVFEAAAKTSVALSTIYRQLKNQEKAAEATKLAERDAK